MVTEELQLDPIPRYPAALQLGAGALGAGFAFVFACPALGIAMALIRPGEVPGWSLIVAALVGMVANAACVVAAFPLRLSQIVNAGMRGSVSGFATLLAVGVLLVARPAAWVALSERSPRRWRSAGRG